MDDGAELAPQLVRSLASGGPATLQVTAIRETFEECAILLAREAGQTGMVSATRAQELGHYRYLLQGGDTSLAQFLARENLLLACDELIHYANWVTPDFMPRRFDTHFFLAVAPPEQQAIEDGHESISVDWIRPAKALELIDSGALHRVVTDHLQFAPHEFVQECCAGYQRLPRQIGDSGHATTPQGGVRSLSAYSH